MTIHFDPTLSSSYRIFVYHAACGEFPYAWQITTDPDAVTCGNCKRTVSYRARKTET